MHRQELEPRIPPASLEIEMGLPDFDSLPIGPELAVLCGYNQTELDRLAQYTEQLHKSHTIYFLPGHQGVGDIVLSLRLAEKLAHTFPHKTIVYLTCPSFPAVENWNLSSNLTFQTIHRRNNRSFNAPLAYDPGVFLLTDQPDFSAQESFGIAHVIDGSGWMTRGARQLFETPLMEPSQRRNVPMQPHILPEIPNQTGIRTGDIWRACNLMLLGVNPSDEGNVRPLIRLSSLFPEADSERTHANFDVLLVPDAHECTVNVGSSPRSEKSVPIDKMIALSKVLPRTKRYGVVIGASHTQHCVSVAAWLADNLDVVQVRCPSLVEFMQAVAKSKLVVGMDSGTTHLAREVAFQRSIGIRQIFNGRLAQVSEYGVSGLQPGQAKILWAYSQNNIGLYDLPVPRIAQFVSEGIEQFVQ